MKKSTWIGLCIALTLLIVVAMVVWIYVVPGLSHQPGIDYQKGELYTVEQGQKGELCGEISSAVQLQPLKQMVSQGKRTTATAGETVAAPDYFLDLLPIDSEQETLALAIWLEADGLYYSEATDTATRYWLTGNDATLIQSVIQFTLGDTTVQTGQAIGPLSDWNRYVSGMTEYSSHAITLDEAGTQTARVVLYTSFQKAPNGEFLWDDGGEWALLVQKGESYYPLMEKTYVQLGTIHYWPFFSYEDGQYHILVLKEQGAGLSATEFVYDATADVFRGEPVYQAANINLQ